MWLLIFALAMACFAMGCGIATLVLTRGRSTHKAQHCCDCSDDGYDDSDD